MPRLVMQLNIIVLCGVSIITQLACRTTPVCCFDNPSEIFVRLDLRSGPSKRVLAHAFSDRNRLAVRYVVTNHV